MAAGSRVVAAAACGQGGGRAGRGRPAARSRRALAEAGGRDPRGMDGHLAARLARAVFAAALVAAPAVCPARRLSAQEKGCALVEAARARVVRRADRLAA